MPAPMNTESRRKASADFHAKRKADGWKKSTHWLSPEAQAALERLKVDGKSADTALNEALIRAATVNDVVSKVAAIQPPAVSAKPKRQAKPKARAASVASAPKVSLGLPAGAKLKDPT